MPAVALSVLVLLSSAQKPADFSVGVQAYSFRLFSTFEAIEMTAKAGADTIELYPGQTMETGKPAKIGPDMGSEAEAALKAHLEKNKVRAAAYGVTGISVDDAGARKLFEWAKRMGIGIVNTESTEALDTIEKMVKEFDIKVGFHNHPRRANDPNYKVWDPAYIASIVKTRDKRIGACADTGHWVRSGIKPMDALRILRGRIVSSHLKDLHEFAMGGHDVPFGQGVSDIRGVLGEFKRQGFSGHASVEYEYNWNASLPDIAQCIGFAKGVRN